MYAFLIGRQGEDPTELSALHFDGLIGEYFSSGPTEMLPLGVASANPNLMFHGSSLYCGRSCDPVVRSARPFYSLTDFYFYFQ
jgi:hypothetical protein